MTIGLRVPTEMGSNLLSPLKGRVHGMRPAAGKWL
jgi:hypothetical protein